MRWCCECSYDGTEFNGWQSQVGGNTIQDYIEHRLEIIFGHPIRIHGSGRTDAGVHARGQVFHFDGDWGHGAEKLLRAFRCGIPRDIQITSVKSVDDQFHARYSVTKKRYVYQYYLGHASPFDRRYKWSIGERKVDVDSMNSLARCLLGQHDFSAFSAVHGDGTVQNPNKTLYRLDFSLTGNDLVLTTEGSGYMYKMVRTLASTFLDIGLNRISKEYVLECFQNKLRKEKITTAPPQGLFLDHVYF